MKIYAPSQRLSAWLVLITSALIFSACSTPGERLDNFAQSNHLQRSVQHSDHYAHVTYAKQNGGGRLHVYLEGDGKPWAKRYLVARDPTSRYGLMLRLMARDNADTLYLARPCYNGYYNAERCNNTLWTGKRYAPIVVNSMANVLNRYITQNGYKEVVLLGHSGGGTLAMLLAPHIKQTTAIVTVTANMDIDAWTTLHRYTPLRGSINPALQAALPPHIWQLHLAGNKDNNSPPSLIQGALRNQPTAHAITFRDYDHLCCWLDIWPEVLNALHQRDADFLAEKFPTL